MNSAARQKIGSFLIGDGDRQFSVSSWFAVCFQRKAYKEVWYHSAMRGPVNRFLAYLLLLLLPVQAQAAVAVLACYVNMTQAVMVVHAMEDCQDASMMQQTMSDAGVPIIKPHPESPLVSYTSPCGMSSSCLALASIAVLPDIRIVLIDPAMQSSDFTDEFYLSYIPEGLERPPRPIRA
ncbi:hypothetical protein ACFQUU_21645 [Herbaspirillum sp. GCM10030257]|uniref:hypothetical protein n=1 Tax=Herbaspirillum sp. GCM10030257 TaxID=3273393 RepID=UPI0036115013